MASAASAAPPTGGVNSSMWASQPPSRQGWGRGGESGSAFRGRPGRGGGRGGRGGGRGGSRMPNTRTDEKVSKSNGVPAREPSQNAPPSAVSTPLNGASSRASSQTQARPRKVSEAKPPRKVVPPIVVEPPPANNSPATPIRSRRKRSQNRSMSNPSSKKSLSTESSTSQLRVEKSPTITKDLPPHLAPPAPPDTPSFDIKHDINALVERVRAVAMERPNTPGSHIDWAGEDDDSLPDLDDWGVKSFTDKSSIPEQLEIPDLLSPMLADTLKPLPSVEVDPTLTESVIATVEQVAASPQWTTPIGTADDKARRPTSLTNNVNRLVAEKAPPPGGEKTLANHFEQPALAPKAAIEQVTATKPSPKQFNPPLHPSLPAKPVEAIDALSKRVPRKPVPVQTPDPATDVDMPVKSGLSESMHAPKPSNLIPPENSGGFPSESQALIPPSQSAPSHITSHSAPFFQPGHGRAHTIGRPRDLRAHNNLHAALLDPDERGRNRLNHARTHSSPPTGPGTSTAHSRTVHATRPVITKAALSGLAKTLVGGSPPKREVTSVAAASKD